jgi:hypothetical protein
VSARLALLTILLTVAASTPAVTQVRQSYQAPRTEYGHPDFQGKWATAFLTMLERLPGVENLVASPEQAKALVAGIRAKMPAVIDPDALIHDIRQLVMVKGEYRTSIVEDPKNGQIPFTKAGLDLSAKVQASDNQKEDSSGPRIIPLVGRPVPGALRSIGGYSMGRWEGDTLVVDTTNLRADYPARTVVGRPLVLSRNTKITERFTRVSPTELFYRFTIEDGELYTQPWTGEFSMTRYDGPIYEYACHEANYSLMNVLQAGRVLEKQGKN